MAKVLTSGKPFVVRGATVGKAQLIKFSNPAKDVSIGPDKKNISSWSGCLLLHAGHNNFLGRNVTLHVVKIESGSWQSVTLTLTKLKSLRGRKGLLLGMLPLLATKGAGGGGASGGIFQNLTVALGASAAGQKHDTMKLEALRVASFKDFPSNVVSAIRLAAAGFFATRRGDEVECFSCHVRHANWKTGDEPKLVHRQLRPECRFLQGEVPGVPFQDPNVSPQDSLASPRHDDQPEELDDNLHLNVESIAISSERPGNTNRTWSYGNAMTQNRGERSTSQSGQNSLESHELLSGMMVHNSEELQRQQLHQEQQQQPQEQQRLLQEGQGQQQRQQEQQQQQQQQEQGQQQQQQGQQQTRRQPNSQQRRAHNRQQQQRLQQQQYQMQPGEHLQQQNQQHHQFHQQHQRGGLQRPSEGTAERSVAGSSSTGATSQAGEPTSPAGGQSRLDQPLQGEKLQDLLNINVGRARYPQYALLLRRQESLATWPGKDIQDIEVVAEAGFFYSGHGDGLRCFHCDGGLKNWQQVDDPWVEHARWFPRCSYVRQCKGDPFLATVRELLEKELNTEDFYARLREKMNANGATSGRSVEEETAEIRDEVRCKICLEKEVSIIFLPCGHLVSCPVCAPALARCPVCRQRIQATFKAYMN